MAKLPPLGAHVSTAGGMPRSIENGCALACTAIQVFVKNANQWRGRTILAEEVSAFHSARGASAIGSVIAHASYLINLAAIDPEILEKSKAALADEITRCADLRIEGLVLHPGAHLGTSDDEGIARAAASLNEIFAGLPDRGTRVLLENTAGQGSTIGWRLEHLEAIRARLSFPERTGVCLDTCHAFAAGYAIHEPAGYEEFAAEAAERFGPALGAFHLNDSAKPFASRRDRHEHIGEGEIGCSAFARLLADPRFATVPMVLETEPGDNQAGLAKDLEVLRGLVA
ncbi:MAG TPA: deoxyribonuclease IV [Thermoanaerobaculia bacterium]|nr:deoxyribonuclease IV [Thermoanaerobaculia bacterium]